MIVITIDGSEKRNCEGGVELQSNDNQWTKKWICTNLLPARLQICHKIVRTEEQIWGIKLANVYTPLFLSMQM